VIKPSPIKNAAAIGRYFAEETASMRWSGKVADFLQIKGRRVTKDELTRASAGYCPLSSQPLYQRHSTNRRLGWDILFMPPKSISVAALVGTGGDRIVRAHSQAVETAFNALAEPAAAVSARSDLGLHNWRTTGAMLFTHVVHRTNREKEPHLHSHLLVMNTTLDAGRRLMGLETGPVFERFGAMEKMYNHELARNLRREGIACSLSLSGDTIIPEIEDSLEIQQAFSKAHTRILRHASLIAEEIQSQRARDGLIPLGHRTIGFLSKQIANDRHRPAKESGIERKITRSHWRHSIDQDALEVIDRCSKPSKGLRLRTFRNGNTQSVLLPSIIADLASEQYPLRNRRNISAVQVMVHCTERTPDLSAKRILESALSQCQHISNSARRKRMESQIKVGLALAGITPLDGALPSSRIQINDPVLSTALGERLTPLTRRIRLAQSIDRNVQRHEERRTDREATALTQALHAHFQQRRRYVQRT
jgi:conjugative relaxase-like TrwC/TraI family protein